MFKRNFVPQFFDRFLNIPRRAYCSKTSCSTQPLANAEASTVLSKGGGSSKAMHTCIPTWLTEMIEASKKLKRDMRSQDLHFYDTSEWQRRAHSFDNEVWDPNNMTMVAKQRLCLGQPHKEYTLIGEIFSFPDQEDNPVVNNPGRPAKLWWDHSSPTQKVLVQLSDHFPPLLWPGVIPQCESLLNLFTEFLDIDAKHMKLNIDEYESKQKSYEEQLGTSISFETSNKHQLRDLFMRDLRNKDPADFRLDWEKDFSMYLGTADNFRVIEERWKRNPFCFGWPLMLSDGNHYMENQPLHCCAFRTIMSKSILSFQSRVDLQLESLATLRSTQNNDEENPSDILLEVPVLTHINYQQNRRLCGGPKFVQRYNKIMGTDFPEDTPVDVLAALCREVICKSPRDVYKEVEFLAKLLEKGVQPDRTPRLPTVLHSTTKLVGQISYNVVYLACMEYDRWVEDIYKKFSSHPEPVLRIALAKGASIVMRPDLVEEMIQLEKDDEVQASMKKLIDMGKSNAEANRK